MNAKLITPLDKSILYPRFRKLIEILQEKGVIQYGLLVALTLLAAVMRLYKLGEWSFWIDEIFTIDRAQIHFSDAAAFLRSLPSTLWLPLSVIFTEIFLKNLGVSEWSARLAPALIGIASVPILFFPVRKLAGLRVALIFAFLLAISPWHVFWSQNARFYTSLMLLYTLASLALFYSVEYDRPIFILIFYVLFYFAVSERMLAIFILPVFISYLFALRVFRYDLPMGFRKQNILLITFPILGMLLFDGFHYLLYRSSFILNTIYYFAGIIIDSPIKIFILILLNIGIPLICLALLSGICLIKGKNRLGLFLFINAVVTSLVIAFGSLFFFVVDRYAIITLPHWIILASFSVAEAYRKFKPRGLLIGFGALLLLIADAGSAGLMYYQLNHGNRPEWKRAFEFVIERAQPNDVIVSSVPDVGEYYTNREVLALGDLNIEAITQNGTKYWFVLDSENSWFAGEQKAWVEENADLLEIYYLRVREQIFLKIYSLYPGYVNPAR